MAVVLSSTASPKIDPFFRGPCMQPVDLDTLLISHYLRILGIVMSEYSEMELVEASFFPPNLIHLIRRVLIKYCFVHMKRT